MTWPLLADEAERLRTVEALHLLDTPPEARFDRITRLASRVLSVPIAFVSLIDADRQWFKSVVGLDAPEVPRDEAICGFVVSEDSSDTFVLDDASADPRFASLPRVAGDPGVRGYSSRVLRVRGKGVGTLCVADYRARQFSPDDLELLEDLAQWAEAELRADEERRTAHKLDALQRRTEMVLAGVAEGVVGVNREGVTTFVNAAAQQLLGRRAPELLGMNLHAMTHGFHRDGRPFAEAGCPVTHVLATGQPQRTLFGTFWRHDGSSLTTDWSVGPVVEDGQVVGAVVVFSDASRRLQAETMKDEFIGVVSHELRTPLTSLKGALDLLSHGVGGELDERAKPLLDIASRNAQRLAHLVDDILDVEKSARGDLVLQRRPLEVDELMRSAAATVQGTAVTSGIDVVVTPAGAVVWGDEHRLLQVLTNLLGNAMRFSPAGSTVEVRCEQDALAVRISVRDEGVGIPEEAQSRVFDRFWQVDTSARRARGGTGLGLAIAKSIVEAHGGYITLDSEVGAGSTFTVSLPLRSRASEVPMDRRRHREPTATEEVPT